MFCIRESVPELIIQQNDKPTQKHPHVASNAIGACHVWDGGGVAISSSVEITCLMSGQVSLLETGVVIRMGDSQTPLDLQGHFSCLVG